ncbi:MAG: transporter substrate-binding domain-containing protein [Pseudomonadota bacterium]
MSIRRYLPFLILLSCAPAAAGPAAPLTMCYEDVPQRPWSTPAGIGLNFELLKRVEKQLGERFVYAPKPWRRCLEEVRIGAIDAVIGAADSTERRSFAMFPTLPDGSTDPARALFEDKANVFLRVGGQASWDGHILLSPKGEVAVPSGYLIGTILRERGLRAKELVKSADDALRLLVNGVFDAAVLQGAEASNLALHDARFQDRVVQAQPPYAVLVFHLMVGRASYARDAQRIEAIWRAIGTVRQSDEYRQLAADAGVVAP